MFLRSSGTANYTESPDSNAIRNWILSTIAGELRIFKTYEDVKELFPDLQTIFIGYFDNRNSIEFKIYESVAHGARAGSLYVAVVNSKIDNDKIEFVNLIDNFTEEYNGNWDWVELTSWIEQVQYPWYEEFDSDNAEKYLKLKHPLALVFYDKIFTKEEEIAEKKKNKEDLEKKLLWLRQQRDTKIIYYNESKEKEKEESVMNKEETRIPDWAKEDNSAFDEETKMIHRLSELNRNKNKITEEKEEDSEIASESDASSDNPSSSSSSSSEYVEEPSERDKAIALAIKIGKKYRKRVYAVTISYRRHWRWAEIIGISNNQIPGFALIDSYPSYEEAAKVHYPLWVEKKEREDKREEEEVKEEKKEENYYIDEGTEVVDKWKEMGSSNDFDTICKFIDDYFAGKLKIRLRTEDKSKNLPKYSFDLDYLPDYLPYSYHTENNINKTNTSSKQSESNETEENKEEKNTKSSSSDSDDIIFPSDILSDSAVKRVTGLSFNKTIFAGRSEVAILFHTSWCAHCPRTAAAFEKVAWEYRERKRINETREKESSEKKTNENNTIKTSLSFASFDCSQNDPWPRYKMDAFPTILLFRSRDTSLPSVCKNCYTMEKIKAFLREHSSVYNIPANEEEVKLEEKAEKKKAKLLKLTGLDQKISRKKVLFEDEL